MHTGVGVGGGRGQATLGLFHCAFARRNCTHTQLFRREYQRTNRTKENKILRCFPHCCPQHVVRSYCGASLHVQVDFREHEGESPRGGRVRKPARGDDLMVFGRFRPDETRALEMGTEIPGATILSSLQSEDNPAGEWIEARLIASVDQSAWLFEVNPSARWCYNWGSSAAKDKRQQKHVFDVYVLYQPNGEASSTLQVVACVSSSSFNIVSFRRAPSGVRNDADVNANTTSNSSPNLPTRMNSLSSTDDNPTRMSSFSSADDNLWEEKPEVLMASSRTRRISQASSRRSYSANNLYSHFSSGVDPESRSQPHYAPMSAHYSRDATDDLTRWQGELQALCSFFAAIPLASCLEEVSSAQARYRRALVSMWPRLMRSSHHVNGTIDPTIKRVLAQLGARTQLRGPQLRPDLMQEVVALAFWLRFHAPFQHEVEAQMQQAATVLLARPALIRAHAQWVRWLYQRIDEHLQQQARITLSNLVYELRAVPNANSIARTSIGLHVTLPEFIAQVSEVYVALARRNHNVQPSASLRQLPAQMHHLDGTWLCDLENLHLRRRESALREGDIPGNLEHLLGFWRQLSCISLQVDMDLDQQPSLEISSVFHPDARSGRVTRLVLDNNVNWFRVFPCGESTAAHTCGGQTFGDYRGYVTSSGSVVATLFSWPSVQTEASSAIAFCWHWRLQATSAQRLEVSFLVQRGIMTHMDASLAMEALGARLARVQEWNDYLEAELTFERAERGIEQDLEFEARATMSRSRSSEDSSSKRMRSEMMTGETEFRV